MKLHYQTHSPSARKALVFAHTPLDKVPVLVCPGGPTLFDSDLICAYLETQHGGPRLVPIEGDIRWQALQVQAIAQGLVDAGVALRWETVRRPPHLRYPPLADGCARERIASYDWLERVLPVASPVQLGLIALATALNWLEFRQLPAFRSGRARLTAVKFCFS
jgi:glutathione S-transferase